MAGIGVILGAGVYALIGPAAGLAGDALWLAFLLAGLTAGLTAYSYARLGAMQPLAAAEFQYTSLAFGPRIGFLAGWLMLVADVAAAGAVALGFGGYLGYFLGTSVTTGALLLLAGAGAVAFAGMAKSVALAIALTVVEAAGLVFVVVVGAPSWGRVDVFAAPPGVGGVAGAAALIFFAYIGFDELGNFTEEMRTPARDLPRALAISMIVTTAVYIAVALSATAVVPWQELASSPAPLALVVGHVLGPRAASVLAALALAATANTVLLLLISAARAVYGMGRAGVLPSWAGRVGRRAIPTTATFVVLAAAAGLVLTGDLRHVAILTDAAVLVSFTMVNLSLAWLALRRRTGARGATQLADCMLPVAAAALCVWLAWHTGWLGLLGALAILVAGACLLPATRRAAC
jgi:APA family basic amino acid/polyamine antiporter